MEKVEAILRQLLTPTEVEHGDFEEVGDPVLEHMAEIEFGELDASKADKSPDLVAELANAIRELVDERVAELTAR